MFTTIVIKTDTYLEVVICCPNHEGLDGSYDCRIPTINNIKLSSALISSKQGRKLLTGPWLLKYDILVQGVDIKVALIVNR